MDFFVLQLKQEEIQNVNQRIGNFMKWVVALAESNLAKAPIMEWIFFVLQLKREEIQ